MCGGAVLCCMRPARCSAMAFETFRDLFVSAWTDVYKVSAFPEYMRFPVACFVLSSGVTGRGAGMAGSAGSHSDGSRPWVSVFAVHLVISRHANI